MQRIKQRTVVQRLISFMRRQGSSHCLFYFVFLYQCINKFCRVSVILDLNIISLFWHHRSLTVILGVEIR